MKNLLVLGLAILLSASAFAQKDELSPYLLLKKEESSINKEVDIVKRSLISANFRITGEYSPMASENLYVLTYTREDLETIALDFENRGALAATLKVGFKKEGKSISVSMTNPMYQFYAYFTDNIKKHEQDLLNISKEAIAALSIGVKPKPLGGLLKIEKLQKYHYKIMMPYFDDVDKLNTFISFEDGLSTIRKNLSEGNSHVLKVYELIYPEKQIAVFGIGLSDPEKGEAHFLPIIGDGHICALPYELILQGNEASSLAGKYRIALHWPELTMGTFMKIMSTPGDIKKELEQLTK